MFFGILRQTGLDGHGFVSKSWNWKFDFSDLVWPDIDLSWGHFLNEYHHQIMRPKTSIKYVSHDIHATFSFIDLIWPDLEIDLYLV